MLKDSDQLGIDFEAYGARALNLAEKNEEVLDALRQEFKRKGIIIKEKKTKNVVDGTIWSGTTELQQACLDGNQNKVIQLMTLEDTDVAAENIHGNTCFHHASLMGRDSILQILLKESVADINFQNNQGDTPLHLACLWGLKKTVSILSEEIETRLLDINVTNGIGQTPFQVACNYLRGVRSEASIDIVKYLLKRPGINVNARVNQNGDTVFHIASSLGFESIVSLLLDDKSKMSSDCDINALNSDGLTGFQVACQKMRHGVIKIILKSGKIDIPDEKFEMPCGYTGRLEIIYHSPENITITEPEMH